MKKNITLLLITLTIFSTQELFAGISTSLGFNAINIQSKANSIEAKFQGSGISFGVDYTGQIAKNLENYVGIAYTFSSELDKATFVMDDLSFSGTLRSPSSFSAPEIHAGLRYKLTKNYSISGGLNYTSLNYKWEEDTSFLKADSGLGYHIGIGVEKNDWKAEIIYKLVSTNTSGQLINSNYTLNTGKVEIISIQLSYNFSNDSSKEITKKLSNVKLGKDSRSTNQDYDLPGY